MVNWEQLVSAALTTRHQHCLL